MDPATLRRCRQFWFTHYWWITISLLGLIIMLALLFRVDNPMAIIATATIGAASCIYVVQKQKLEELQLFEKLFTQFNARYAAMHLELQKAMNDRQSPAPAALLDAYFNLCAEEYLFWSEGRIHADAWKTWRAGMQSYLKHESFLRYCSTEVQPATHYGLELKRIMQDDDD